MLKQMGYRGIVITSLLLLAGCSTLTELRADFADRVFGREPPNPPAELQEFKPSHTAKIDWSGQIGETARYDYTPALEAGTVYASNALGELTKLDASNGGQFWRVNVGEPISGSVGTGGGLVLVGSSRGNLFAYDVNGKLLWKSKVSSEILSAPRYFDGVVIARSGDNRIFGFDAADGSRKWIYERTTPALSLRSSAGVVVDGGAVYAGFAGGKMVAVRADNGKLLWEATVAVPKGVTEIERIADITSLPVIDGPIVYAVAYQGRVAAVDRIKGKVVWNRDISSYTGMGVEDSKLFISHTLGSVYSLDYATGKTFWRQAGLLNRRLTAPLPLGNLIAVGDLEGYVHFLNREEGGFSARIKLDDEPVMSMIAGASPSKIIVATRGGGLYAVSVTEDNAKPNPLPETRSEPAKPSESAPELVAPQSGVPESSAPSTERSILFQNNDSILLPQPDAQAEPDITPGISLPSPEPQ
ncbi:MAG: outer membrane protein assembly factor BamB [Methylophilaceae bacterium]